MHKTGKDRQRENRDGARERKQVLAMGQKGFRDKGAVTVTAHRPSSSLR